jgi:hypothetical protein
MYICWFYWGYEFVCWEKQTFLLFKIRAQELPSFSILRSLVQLGTEAKEDDAERISK